jgi:ketosteroid isomerase-like protein
MKTHMTSLTLGLFLVLLSCTQSTVNKKDEIARLLKTDKDWAEASSAGDGMKMASYYDSMGVAVSGTRLIKGHPDLEQYWTGALGSPGFHLTWEAQGADISGDLGYTYGLWNMSIIKENDTTKSQGIYLATWRKQSNGDWKVLFDKP